MKLQTDTKKDNLRPDIAKLATMKAEDLIQLAERRETAFKLLAEK
jgi:hypothetical protein